MLIPWPSQKGCASDPTALRCNCVGTRGEDLACSRRWPAAGNHCFFKYGVPRIANYQPKHTNQALVESTYCINFYSLWIYTDTFVNIYGCMCIIAEICICNLYAYVKLYNQCCTDILPTIATVKKESQSLEIHFQFQWMIGNPALVDPGSFEWL